MKTVDSVFIEDFGKYHNLTVESRVKINCFLFTPEGFRRLTNHDTDTIVGPKAEDTQILNNLVVVCWYMSRDTVCFAPKSPKATF